MYKSSESILNQSRNKRKIEAKKRIENKISFKKSDYSM